MFLHLLVSDFMKPPRELELAPSNTHAQPFGPPNLRPAMHLEVWFCLNPICAVLQAHEMRKCKGYNRGLQGGYKGGYYSRSFYSGSYVNVYPRPKDLKAKARRHLRPEVAEEGP